MRLLIMFGPMIIRQVQKMSRNNARQQGRQSSNRRLERGPRTNRERRGQTRKDRGEQVEYKDLNKELGRPTKEERDFDLTEEDIMLDKEDLRHYDKKNNSADMDTKSIDAQLDELKEAPVEKTKPSIDNDDLDLKDIFLNE